MQPGEILIKTCPNCGVGIRERTLRSGNTFGATIWTDGFREAPMLPDMPALVKCAKCAHPAWLPDLTLLGEIEPWDEKHELYHGSADPDILEVEDYFAVISSGNLPVGRMEYVRRRAWWRFNDAYRFNEDSYDLTTDLAGNMESLLELHSGDSAGDILWRAEILRELGRFAEARTTLESFTEQSHPAAVFQFELIDKKDRRLRQLAIPER